MLFHTLLSLGVTEPPKPRVPTPIIPLSHKTTDVDAKPADTEASWRSLQKTYSKRAPTPPAVTSEAAVDAPEQVDPLITQPSMPDFVAIGGGEVLTLGEDPAAEDESSEEQPMEAGPSLSTLGAGAERVVFLET